MHEHCYSTFTKGINISLLNMNRSFGIPSYLVFMPSRLQGIPLLLFTKFVLATFIKEPVIDFALTFAHRINSWNC